MYDDFGADFKDDYAENEPMMTKQVVNFENTMDDFGEPTGEVNEDDEPTGDGDAGMGMSIMDGYNKELGMSM